MSHLLHIRGNENEIHAAESKLRDTQKYINQFSATKLQESNINNKHIWSALIYEIIEKIIKQHV